MRGLSVALLFHSAWLLLALPGPAASQACTTDFDCASTAAPVCVANACAAGPSQCTGDDSADAGGADDGPAGARAIQNGTLQGSICNVPAGEADFYESTVLAGAGMLATLTWSGAPNLDLTAYDSTGRTFGFSLHTSPEVVDLSILEAGTYYFRVSNSTPAAATAAVAYEISVTTTVQQACATRADCAAEFSTQLFRGVCANGNCVATAASGSLAAGQQCDRDGNCASGLCSYQAFEASADRSVCTNACSSNAQCGLGFTCTRDLAVNRCVPACSNDLQCGANVTSPSITFGQPWEYFICDAETGVCSRTLFADGFE